MNSSTWDSLEKMFEASPVMRASAMMGINEGSAFEVSMRFKTQGWKGLEHALVISTNHAGNPVFLNPAGEVWLMDHDGDNEAVKLADSFEGYLTSRCLS